MSFQCIRCKKEIEITFRNCPHCGEAITDFARRYAEEPVDGKYKIVERLGAGGMGEVFKVVHTFLGTTRVIKVIRPNISDSREAHDRFLREARAATKVQDSNVAAMHDFAQLPDGSHYMVWEFIDGENLAQRLRKTGPMTTRATLRIAIQALHGLEAIHRAGIIHRDISPENVMITHADDRVKIIDLGVAKVDDTSATMATATGIFVGKLRYASPEHLGFLGENEKIDARADLYSMAMVIYEMVTGRPPFEATSPHQYFILHSQERKLQAIDYANVPVPLRDVLHRALEHDREKRFASAREFATALEAIEREIPDQSEMATLAETPLPPSALIPAAPIDTLHRETERSAVAQTLPTARLELPAQPSAPAVSTASALPTPTATPTPTAVAPPVAIPTPTAVPSIIEEGGRSSAAQTQITDHKSLKPVDARPASQGGDDRWRLVAVIAGVLLVLAVVGAWIFWPRTTAEHVEASLATSAPPLKTQTTQTTTTQAAPPPSATAVDVIATSTAATTTTLTTTTTPQPTLIEPKPVKTDTAAPPHRVEPEPLPRSVEPVPQQDDRDGVPTRETTQPAMLDGVPLYVDGGDNEDRNNAAMERLRESMAGVSKVAVHAGSSMRQDVIESIRDEVSSVSVVDYADVVVQFQGSIESLGRGRKLRAAQATVKKNGRIVFRYELPREVYRVGATPAEAFARVFSEAF